MNPKLLQFLLYCICGGVGVLSDYGVFFILIKSGITYQIANSFGYLAGTLISFVLNRKVTFSVHDQVALRLLLFLGVATIGFLSTIGLLWFFVEILAINALIAKLLTLPVIVVLQFSLNRSITFKQNKSV